MRGDSQVSARELVTAADARKLLLDAQGLLDDPGRRVTSASVAKLVERLGFVQVDSIQRVERAHHLILGARLDGYRPALLDALAFEKRVLFEHWTHAAAYIPVAFFPHWKPRFVWREREMRARRWYTTRLGKRPDALIRRVYARVECEGPLRARDFERKRTRKSEGWWDWTPEKMALEFLWHTGRLAIAGRERFDKIYDLFERVYPVAHAAPEPTREQHIAWAVSSALERLGAGTPKEIARFWGAIPIKDVSVFCREASGRGQLVPAALLPAAGGPAYAGYALADWKQRARHAPDPPDELRLLAPFDPIVRDRGQALRVFGFDYAFEAYLPAGKRKYGYYVLPVLERDRLIGRIDPRRDRERDALVVDGVFWEPGIRPTPARRRALTHALEKLAARIGVKRLEERR